ncbi:MAG: diguanylate cyclase [Ruminococcus sp.]|nr:diguanylate cyclase [Ruminococcus sp.]
MLNIKKMVVRYLRSITLIMVLVILIVTILLQIHTEQRKARESAQAVFVQIEQLLAENNAELEQVISEYRETCLKNAEGIAYILENNPSALESIEELTIIAEFAEVDEIHIFDKTGTIITGTHPEYFGYTFDSGEQIGYFKPMLEDKELRMVQEVTPNTAEEKPMQYSALWSENGEFIVQIGINPTNIMKLTEKNELSYIFSLLKSKAGIDFYAIDKVSGEIKGATSSNALGKHYRDIGFDMKHIAKNPNGFHDVINGTFGYCIFTESGDNFIGRVVSDHELYKDIPARILELIACLTIVAVILVIAVSAYINKVVIRGIDDLNEKLRVISEGNLDEEIDVRSSREFSELSSHINDMIKSIRASTDKISYILNKTNLNIGVYEYNRNMMHVRCTEHIPKLLALNKDWEKMLFSECELFKEYMDNLRQNPVPEEKNVYLMEGESDRYLRLEEISRGSDTLGIVIDVTEEFVKRRQLEAERDIDLLTGLYNRRGLEIRLSSLFANPEKLGCGALIMVDADGLKEINDKYGHDKGDIYLKKISEAISTFARKSCISSRQGGDEFVLFIYGYENENELLDNIDTLKYLQNNSTAFLDDELEVHLKFSFGYSFTKGESDYKSLLKAADEKMYESKAKRKMAAAAAQ